MNNKAYHQDKALSTTMLKHILENPRKFYAIWSGTLVLEPTSQMKIGQAFHKLVLEPEEFHQEFLILPELNMRKKTDREERDKIIEANPDKVILSKDEFVMAKKLADKVLESNLVLDNFEIEMKLLLKAKNIIIEQAYWGLYEDVSVKCKPDILINLSKNPNKPYYIIIDLKSLDTANPEGFIKNAARYMYHLQVATYKYVLKFNKIDVKRFLFLAVGKDDNSFAEWYELSENDESLGFDLLDRAIKKFKYCYENNEWREGSFNYAENRFESINKIQLPNWAYYVEY